MARVENVCAFAEKAPLRLVGKCITVVVTQSKASQVTNVPLYSMPRYRKVEEQFNEFLLAPTVEPVKT
ncbi:hypothetical protein Naga_100070g6 [Nannochloropsis gaditana]|uniref:Uncharacterized protein n=1 Tax=Nannochloropsis gaditana TaxID=72520 RepID=W7T5X6_9STRA|nr:hypothetical protein Naga_100070g6 [Nannochloropsis gaditana]